MAILLGLLIVSLLLNFTFYIPFINLLYRFKFQRQRQITRDALGVLTPIFDRFHKNKVGTPVGGGLLVILTTPILFGLAMLLFKAFWLPVTSVYPSVFSEVKIILFSLITFGIIGLYDDVKKTFRFEKEVFFGLRLRHKLILELIVAFIVAWWLYSELRIEIVNIPLFGVLHLGILYVPFAAFVILAFANAFNISDGLDGLASGSLLIALVSFWVISASILDTALSVFIPIWLGGLIAFLYFNIFPARIFLGDVGALAFGATFAVIGLILGKPFTLVIIGGIFVWEVASSFLQLAGKKLLGRKLFKVAPFHLLLQERGWAEPKIVMRFWIIGVMLAVLGLWISALT